MIRVLILFISFYNFSFSQENNKQCEVKPFKVYTKDTSDFSNIRINPEGEIMLKISNIYNMYGYILNVIDMKDGWLKINSIEGIDGIDITNFEGWIHNSIVGAAVTHDLDVYKETNSKTKVGKLIGEVDTFKILEVYCEWIKIEGKNITGWIESSKICGNPVTTCP